MGGVFIYNDGKRRSKKVAEDKKPGVPVKVIDLSSVRAGAGPEQQAAPAQGDKPKRKGRPPKAEKQAPGGGGPGKSAKAPRQSKPGPAKEDPAPPPPAPEQPPQLKDASRGKKEEIVYLDLSELHPFQNHPFGVRDRKSVV